MINILENTAKPLMEMSNLVGRYVKTDDIDFSFYFSNKDNSVSEIPHGIRVKICWNPDKITDSAVDGTMELHGDYKYYHSKYASQKFTNAKEINKARKFFKKYKVLFAGVWEKKLEENAVVFYFSKFFLLNDICNELNITENINSIEDLEKYVRENNLFNMND